MADQKSWLIEQLSNYLSIVKDKINDVNSNTILLRQDIENLKSLSGYYVGDYETLAEMPTTPNIKNGDYAILKVDDNLNKSGFYVKSTTGWSFVFDLLSFEEAVATLIATDIQYNEGTSTTLVPSVKQVKDDIDNIFTDLVSIQLTTDNNNGAATYNTITGELNIPEYTINGLAGVKVSQWDSAYDWGDHALAGYAPSSHNHDWSQISGVPLQYPPISHNHDWSEINNVPIFITTEADPIFSAHIASSITNLDISIWGSSWSRLGNTGTDAGANFLGTTDYQDLVFRTDNTERIRIFANGNVAVGINSDGAKLYLKAQGALSTDRILRIRNSGNTADIFNILGNGNVLIGTDVDSGVSLRINRTDYNSMLAMTDGYYGYYFGLNLPASPRGDRIHIWKNSSQTFYNNQGGGHSLLINGNSIVRIGTGDGGTNKNVYLNETGGGNTLIGTTTDGGRLYIQAQGALSTDNIFRIRNSADSADILKVTGEGTATFNGTAYLMKGSINFGATQIWSDSASYAMMVFGHPSNYDLVYLRPDNNAGSMIQRATMLVGYGSWGAIRFEDTPSGSGFTRIGLSFSSEYGTQNYSHEHIGLYYNLVNSGAGRMYAIKALTGDIHVGTGNLSVGTTTNGAKLYIQAQGALSTDNVFRIRNSANNADILKVTGDGNLLLGTTTNVPTSILTLDSNVKGFLPPRMTNAELSAIVSPVNGLLVYQTDAVEGMFVNTSTGWKLAGIQNAADIFGFQSSVSANSDVIANTAARHIHTNMGILDATDEAFTISLKTNYDAGLSWISTSGVTLISHLTDIANPHNVTKAQVGLSNVDDIQQYPMSNPAGYISNISSITAGGDLFGTYPNPSILNSAVLAKVLTGLSISGASIDASDSIIQAFGKLQSQINAVLGGATYQTIWDASTNNPTLSDGIGTKGHYYITSVDGTVNFGSGNIDFKIGDWAIYNGSIWQKVDNTDAVASVNGQLGAVNLTTDNISEVTNLYFTTSRVLTTTLSSFTSASGLLSPSDTILDAIQKLDGNITALTTANIADSTNKRYVTDADIIKLDNTSGTNSGDNAINMLYAGLVSNANHTGEVTGATALTVDKSTITNKALVTIDTNDYLLISDTSDNDELKKVLASDFLSTSGGFPMGNDKEIQFNNAGSFAGAANVEIESGNLALVATTDPTAIATKVIIYAKNIAGRSLPKWQPPSGLDTPFQSGIFFNQVSLISAGGGTVVGTLGCAVTKVGTISHPVITSTNNKTQTRRFINTSATTAGALASTRISNLECWRGNAANMGGFFVVCRFGFTTLQAGMRSFFGLSTTATTAPTNVDPLSSTASGRIGMAINTNSGDWKLIHADGTAIPTVISLGVNFSINTTDMLEMILFAKPNDTVVTYRIKNLQSNIETSGTLSTNLPLNTAFLGRLMWATNNATAAAVAWDCSKFGLETDY